MSQAPSRHELLTWDLCDRLRKSLRVADLSVQEMADHLEVGRNTVGNYLSGRTSPNGLTLRVWALRCGIPLEWLKDGIEPENGPETPGGQVLSASTWNPSTAGQVLPMRRVA